ncbi:hypothetical protein [Actinoplanes sp. NPDC051851]|uniref:hypothetical protein n=1 Tax=Actinoplanes sp. NPDC051851 TaxID=3154753 RepID=UPI00341E6DD6
MSDNVRLAQVLDVLERLLAAARHPEITAVDRFGSDAAPGGPSPAGVRVRYTTGAEAYLWGAVWPGENPLPVPETLPPPLGRRPDRLAVLTAQLLDAVRPPEFASWQLLGLPDLGPAGERGKAPRGIRITGADGTSLLLRVTAAGGPTAESETEPYPDYSPAIDAP